MDQLTGLPARAELASAFTDVRDGTWIPAVFLDIDGFRWVTDQFGHVEADRNLVTIAEWLTREAEAARGRVFRVGGDEFLMLLPERGIAEAAAIANTLVSNCAALRIPYVNPNESRDVLTVSAVVFAADRTMPAQLVTLLDGFGHSLYLAEVARGRNFGNVVVCD